MLDYCELYSALEATPLMAWRKSLPGTIDSILEKPHGDMAAWQAAIDALPALEPSSIELKDAVRIGSPDDAGDKEREALEQQLKKLMPWRKGPFELFGLDIDTEWRSDWKWDRLKDRIQPLQNRTVLDVGSGNGYYCLRMLGAGARMAIGIDPTPLFVMQFHAIKKFTPNLNAFVLPLGIEHMPTQLPFFDTVFSMGVMYHRKDPQQHLQELKGLLRDGGELVLESLVIDGEAGDLLVPDGRYAKMRNVWAIPSVATLQQWLADAGLGNVRVIDVSTTTIAEQHVTEWMQFESLADFLDPNDAGKTIEGHPAPRRALLTAIK